MANINEPIIKTIDMMVDEKIKDLSYDKTIKCVIEDTSNKKNGEYIVSNGEYRFTAYSNGGIYSKNSSVYVTVPNGDFNERKIIIGKCKDNTNTPFNYTSPFDSFIGLTRNILADIPIEKGQLSANSKVKDSVILLDEDVSFDNTYNRLGLSAQFKTVLTKFKIISGHYGLELKLTTDNGEKTLILDTTDMFGNLYSFEGFSLQEKVFDITSLSNISHIVVTFIQYNDFANSDGIIGPETIQINEVKTEISNLFVKDLKLTLGYDLNSLQEDKIFLYSYDNLSYKFENGTVDKKSLEMRWAHKDKENTFYAIENLYDLNTYASGALIYWYKQDLTKEYQNEDNIPYIGSFWHHQKEYDNTFYQSFTPNPDIQYEKFKVIILYNDVYYESNILTFENENQVANPATIDLITRMKITCDDGSNGIYPYYNEGNELINAVEGNRTRKLTFSYVSKYTGDPLLDGAEMISWRIPKNNTMIQKPTDKSDEQGTTVIDDPKLDYYIINRDIDKFNPRNEEELEIVASQYYKIKPNYNPWAANNTIYCIVTRNSIEYTAKIDLFFSIRGNSGTEYTFFITANQPALIMADNEKITLSAHLLDFNSQPIEPMPNIEWKMLRSQKEYSNTNDILEVLYQDVQKENSDIIEATTILDNIILTTYFPIPLRLNKTYNSFEGVSVITYDNTGANPRYNKLPLKIKKDNQDLNNIHWVQSINKITVDKPFKEQNEFLPRLKDNKIYPNKMYIENINDQYSLIAQENGQSVWIQPIFIHMDKYGNSLLNQWDGQQKIDKEGNYILSNMVGAGRKENNNTFSGVLMGEIGNKKENSNFNINQKNKTGLFGYNSGIQTFSLDTQGIATLGPSSKGQIVFDGINGTIQSGGFKQFNNHQTSVIPGMKIDLDDGYFNAQGALGQFKIDFSSSENLEMPQTFFEIDSFSTKNNGEIKAIPLIKISKIKDGSSSNNLISQYFLQSENYGIDKDGNKTGTKIDLNKGTFDTSIGNIGGWNISSQGLSYEGNLFNYTILLQENKYTIQEAQEKANGKELFIYQDLQYTKITLTELYETPSHPDVYIQKIEYKLNDENNKYEKIISYKKYEYNSITELYGLTIFKKNNTNSYEEILNISEFVHDKFLPTIYIKEEKKQSELCYFGTFGKSKIINGNQNDKWLLILGDHFGINNNGSIVAKSLQLEKDSLYYGNEQLVCVNPPVVRQINGCQVGTQWYSGTAKLSGSYSVGCSVNLNGLKFYARLDDENRTPVSGYLDNNAVQYSDGTATFNNVELTMNYLGPTGSATIDCDDGKLPLIGYIPKK